MTTPAGWYPDTNVPGNERYWDGQQWTDNSRLVGSPMAPPPAPAMPVGGGSFLPAETARQAKARAKSDKAYRKASRPFYTKKRVLLPVALIVIIVIIVASSNSANKKAVQAASKTCVGKTYPDHQGKDICAGASHSVSLGGFVVTATPFVAKTDSLGDKALCTSVTMHNTSSDSQDYNVFDFKVQTPGGDVATTSTLSFAGTLDSGAVIAGATKKGLVCTDNKGERGTYVFIYKPNAFESDRGIWLFKV